MRTILGSRWPAKWPILPLYLPSCDIQSQDYIANVVDFKAAKLILNKYIRILKIESTIVLDFYAVCSTYDTLVIRIIECFIRWNGGQDLYASMVNPSG